MATIHVAERVMSPRTPKKSERNPPRMATPLAKKRTHLQYELRNLPRFCVSYHGNAAFGSCSACICVLTPDAAAPMSKENNYLE
ncbi:hypothetical protein GCK72_025612 [Caenorhabditis remanei]|uniref:Uncharacterized protein n=1 Tax=Caenorhabditis remanei TaxID=31234 RepID=A0A6A5G345_CAERE|nr:hypothetical protein GCK72_025612 [Caenorhabditis remanei]KAF1749145.1 hypothetical protein GCK72_025612 [Caenorhabditis remanei]